MLVPRYIVGYTGHRSGFDGETARGAIHAALVELKAACESAGGTLEAYGSLAQGADVIFAEEARALGVPLHLLLPLPWEEFARDFSDTGEAEHARRIWEEAGKTKSGSARVLATASARPDCYGDQGARMLDACDVLVALWNGRPAKGRGGAQRVIAQARSRGIPVIVIPSGGREILRDKPVAEVFPRDKRIGGLVHIAGEPTGNSTMNPEELQKLLGRIAEEEAGMFRPSLVRIILFHGIAAFSPRW